MERLTPPESLNLDGTNLADSWRQWRQRFELFSVATELTSKDAKIQSATLLHVIGPTALEVYNTFTWDNEDDKQKVETILAKFAAYCIPRTMSRGKGMYLTHATRETTKILTSTSPISGRKPKRVNFKI